MNFLSHFFLDRTRPESRFAIGAATPDLLSIFDPSQRVKKRHTKALEINKLPEKEAIFVEGVDRHFHADAVFHSSQFFTDQVRYLSEQMNLHFPGPLIPRKFFIAHILLELILDKVLINNNPEILDEYYKHFEAVEPVEVQKLTEKVVANHLPNYAHFIEKFRDNRYLKHYTDWNHIIYVLKRILRRVRIPEEKFTEDPLFIYIIKSYEEKLEKEYLPVFEEIRTTE